MRKVIVILVTVLTSVSCASSEVPGLRAKLYNIPYNFEFRNNPKFHENLSTKFALSTETAALTNIDFDLSHKMDLDVFVEEHSGYFVAPIDGIYEFSLDAQIEARLQIGAGDFCNSDACNSVSAENTLKSPGSKNLAVGLQKGNAYPIRVAQYLSKDAESGKPFISLSYMNPKGEYVNDISPYIYQAEAGVAPFSSTGTLKTSVRSCGGIKLTGQAILRRVFADFDKKKYDMVKDAKSSAFETMGYVRKLEPQAKIYENIINSRKFAVEITGFMKVQNTGTYKFEVNLQGAVALQIGQAGQDMAKNQPILALNAKAKPEIKSHKKTLSAEEIYPIRIVFINKRAKAQFALKVYHEKEALDFQTIFFTDSFSDPINSAFEGSEINSEASSLDFSRSMATTGEQESAVENISGDSMDSHYLSALHDSFEEDSYPSAIGYESLRLNDSTENTISSFPELPREPILESSKGRPKGAKSRKPRSPSRKHVQSRPSQIGVPLPNMHVQPNEEPANLDEPSTSFGDASVIHSSLFPSGVDASVSRFEVPIHVPPVSPSNLKEIGDSHVFKPSTSHSTGPLVSSSDGLTRPDEALVSYHGLSNNLDGGLALLNDSTSRNDSLVVLDNINILNDSPSKDDGFAMRPAIELKILETGLPPLESLALKGGENHRSADGKVDGNSSLNTSETIEVLQEVFPGSDDDNLEQLNNTSISWRSTGSIASVSEPCVVPFQISKQTLSASQVLSAPESNIPFSMTSSSDCQLEVGKWKAQDHMKAAKGEVATNISIVRVCPKSHGLNNLLGEGALTSGGAVKFGSVGGATNFTRIHVASNFSQQLGDPVFCVNKSSEIGERFFSCGTLQRLFNLTRSLELNLCGECKMICSSGNTEAGLSKFGGAWSEKPAQSMSHDLLFTSANALIFTSCPPYADSQESVLSQTAALSKISGSGLPLSSTCIDNCATTVGFDAEASTSTIKNDLSISTSFRRGDTGGSVVTLAAAGPTGNTYDAGAAKKGLRKLILLAAYVTLLW